MESGKRFRSELGKQYDLFRLACPHNDMLQSTVRDVIKNHFDWEKINSLAVLDIGCGNGETTLYILSAHAKVMVTAIDNEHVMIERAKTLLSDFIPKRVTLVQKDALQFLKDIKNESVDAIASVFTIHNWDHAYRSQVLKEVFRVLKKGGIFVNADKYAHNRDAEHHKHFNWQLRQLEAFDALGKRQLAREWRTHQQEDNSPLTLMREQDSLYQLNALGFSEVKKIYRNHMEAAIVAKKGS